MYVTRKNTGVALSKLQHETLGTFSALYIEKHGLACQVYKKKIK